MATETIKVPDIGGSEDVEVIEVNVAVGDTVELEDTLIVLETDKASMDIPSTQAGKVTALKVKEGDKVSEGSPILELEVEATGEEQPEAGEKPEASKEPAPEPKQSTEKPAEAGTSEMDIPVPDLGGSEGVEVIEINVAEGDQVEEGDDLIVLETDKASMEIPSPASGTITKIALKEGDKVSQGDIIGRMKTAGDATQKASDDSASEPKTEQKAASGASQSGGEQELPVPDIGGSEGVEVIEVCVAAGDHVSEGDSLIVLETDKASMEIPSPAAGTIKSVSLKEGDRVSQGDLIGMLEADAGVSEPQTKAEDRTQKPQPQESGEKPATGKSDASSPATAHGASSEVINSGDVYAGPAVRKLGRQLGVDLARVKGSGPRGRITKDDLRDHVKEIVTTVQSGAAVSGGGGIPAMPQVDFAKFGEIETVKMSKIKKLTADNMTRSWLNVPHVTQWDDIDITEMEAFRKGLKTEAEKRGTKLTPLPFLVKACAAALEAEPSFNVSIHHDGEHMVHKKYVHIGMAVDTPNGLMVPVIRDANKKGLWQLTEEINALAKKARDGKLQSADMQGGCFTISSLGAMGGSGFTPIVNTPEVGILGVSRAQVKPLWNGKEFEPKTMLPISLSYDHRAVNGADAGRFFTFLASVLADVRRLLL